LTEALERYATRISGAGLNPERHAPNEIYRRYLDYVLARLKAARSEPDDPAAYSHADEFESDLLLIRDSLTANNGDRAARLVLDPLLRQVATFGFHLHTIDIRQHAQIHSLARSELSTASTASDPDTFSTVSTSEGNGRRLDSLRVIRDPKHQFPAEAICSYVISGANLRPTRFPSPG
jgi:phosphoenolpyruvate carboxylase